MNRHRESPEEKQICDYMERFGIGCLIVLFVVFGIIFIYKVM